MNEEICWRRKADSLKIIHSTGTVTQHRSLEPKEKTFGMHLSRVIIVQLDFVSSVRKKEKKVRESMVVYFTTNLFFLLT